MLARRVQGRLINFFDTHRDYSVFLSNIVGESEMLVLSEPDMAVLVGLFKKTNGRIFKGNPSKRPEDARIIYYEAEKETYWCHPRDLFLVKITMLDMIYGKVR